MKFSADINGKGRNSDLEAHIQFECEAMEFVEMMKADKDTIQLIMSIFDKKMDQKREERNYNIESMKKEVEILREENKNLKEKIDNTYNEGYNDGYESGRDDIIREKAIKKR